jgi:hypothetical protein
VRKRFLTVLAISAFALTLIFAVAAGAQDESTDSTAPAGGNGGGGGIQVQQVQQQQAGSGQVTVQAVSCPGAQHERTVTDPTRRHESHPDIAGGAVRITYEVFDDPTGDDELVIELRDEDGDVIESITVDDNTQGERDIRVSTDPGRHEFVVEADAGVEYRVELEDCTNVEARNDDDENDPPADPPADPVDPVDPAQDPGTADPNATADPATTDPTATADAAAEDGGDSANREGSFRCESFLHVVRDEDGALRWQYRDGDRDDELIVHRFEQCLEADVIASTIPDRLLPDTGGPLLPLGGGALLLVAAAILAGRMIRR